MTQSAQIIIISAIFSSLVATGVVSGILYMQPQSAQISSQPAPQAETAQQTTTKQIETALEQSAAANQKIEDLEQKITKLQASYDAAAQNTQTKQTAALSFSNQVIYLGSATTNHRDWTKTGVEVTLNSTDYPRGTQARFEAGLKIIGGEASARLVNKTTGAIFNISEVSHNTNTTTWKGSPPFSLHSGNNIYVVELRSSSGETAVLDGSRIILEK
jgi:hypothetical protein